MGINLADHPGGDVVRWIWQAIDRNAVLVFRNQRMSDAELRDFGARFGPLEPGPITVTMPGAVILEPPLRSRAAPLRGAQ